MTWCSRWSSQRGTLITLKSATGGDGQSKTYNHSGLRHRFRTCFPRSSLLFDLCWWSHHDSQLSSIADLGQQSPISIPAEALSPTIPNEKPSIFRTNTEGTSKKSCTRRLLPRTTLGRVNLKDRKYLRLQSPPDGCRSVSRDDIYNETTADQEVITSSCG